MANADPHKARAAKKQKALQRAGSPDELLAIVWRAIETASGIVEDPAGDAATRLRAVHAITQSVGSYTRLLEATEFEARLRALEQARIDDLAAGI